jgi:pre-mRNA 3'-end-processing factor FIP1
LYASKQESLRSEFSADKIAQNNKKMFEDMNMMMAMGAMPGMIPGTAGASMPGMEGMPPEMQAMMQQMMAQGADPSQMDPSAMFGGVTGASAAQGGQGQGFGGQGGFGQGQNQFGYEGNNRGGGNFRGRGNRRGQW